MGNPQLEDGYMRISIEIIDRFKKLHLSGNEWQIVWVVLRKTWGWGKKTDTISLSQFQEESGLSRPSVTEALRKLVGKKVLVLHKQTYISTYSFNKLYDEWDTTKLVPKRVLVGFSVATSTEKGTTLVPKKEPKLVPKKEHTIDNIDTYTKDTIQKKYTSLAEIDSFTITEISGKYQVPESFVVSKLDDMTNWLGANGRRYKDYRLALMNWVKKDSLKIKKEYNDKSKIVFIDG